MRHKNRTNVIENGNETIKIIQITNIFRSTQYYIQSVHFHHHYFNVFGDNKNSFFSVENRYCLSRP